MNRMFGRMIPRYLSRMYDPSRPLRPRPKSDQARRPHRFIHLYGTQAWRLLRTRVLGSEPLCRGCGNLATDVDHVQPHRGDERLFYDLANLQPLCKACHQRKTRVGA